MSGSDPVSSGTSGRWQSSEAVSVSDVSVSSDPSSSSASISSTRDAWKHPGYCDYRKVIRLAVQSDPRRHGWQIIDYVDVHGNQRADLRFELILADEGAGSGALVGFGFDRDGPLSVWPFWLQTDQPSDSMLWLVPERSSKGVQQLALRLQALSTSDWHLLRSLCDLMMAQYAALSRIDRRMRNWLAGLERFAKLLASWPATLRFDGVAIQRVVQQGDYAHLSLALTNVVTARGRFSSWDFRLATVATHGVFDANPRLEFGRGASESVFERWFAESQNAFGDNLEVRFARQEQLVDLPLVWHRLTDSDRRLVGQLVEQLPQIVARVAVQSSALILQRMGEQGQQLFEGFKQLALTMRSCWRTQLGTAWEC